MHRSVCTVILRMVCRLSSGQRATRRYRMLFFFSSTNGLAVSFVWQRERQEKPRGEGGVQEKLFIIINILMKMSSILGGGLRRAVNPRNRTVPNSSMKLAYFPLPSLLLYPYCSFVRSLVGCWCAQYAIFYTLSQSFLYPDPVLRPGKGR